MAMLDDRYLLWRLKQGSPRALCRIYSRYEKDLLTLATSLLGRADQAEDVLHDVFLKFVESVDTFELTSSLRAYLATCVANRARDYRRKEQRHAGETMDPAQGVETRQHGPLQAAMADEQRQRVITALAVLPDEQREVVLLHLQAGLKFREIARAQGISAKTAWSRYRYGLDRLRSLLNSEVES